MTGAAPPGPARIGLRDRIRGAAEERVAFMAPARRLRLADTVEAVERHAPGSVSRLLDAGCGDGMLALSVARAHPAWDVLGVDLREELLSAARARAGARGLRNVRFARADLTASVPEDGFDVVLAVECLSEIPDDEAAIRTFAGALAPGGVLGVHVPERSWTPVLPGSDPTWRDEVRHGYDDAGLRALLEGAGLEVLEVRPTYRGTAAAAQEVRDRLRGASLGVRAALYPFMLAAVALERRGATFGRPSALLAVARRPAAQAPATASP